MQSSIVIERFGGPEVLTIKRVAVQQPGMNEVRVRVRAAGVAFSDVWLRTGRYPGGPRPPFTPGYDIYGEIEALGEGVQEYHLGQSVAALTVVGGYAETIVLPTNVLVPAPPALDPAEAVSLVQSYLTAYQMLHRIARVSQGERALIHGAGGAVGLALLQLGRHAGLELYATASATKHAVVSEYGAIPIDYRREDFVARLHALTGDGVDVVFDAIGGRHLSRSLGALRAGGRVIAYGFHGGRTRNLRELLTALLNLTLRTRFDALRSGDANQGIFAFNVTTLRDQRPDWYRADLNMLFALLEGGVIKPHIAGRMTLAEASAAHTQLEQANAAGKYVLIP